MENNDNQTQSGSPEIQSGSPEKIPSGFSLIPGPNGHSVLVPKFMVPATELAIETEAIRTALDPEHATAGVSLLFVATVLILTIVIFLATAVVECTICGGVKR
jgi:hypothetical protein